ncbi:hypothetical protein [Limosilactobacillus reuteri]|uniref:hypothetical protein n=1 Tax=Limosilactobacillus reuteri TaxID=1598 RepID=UPI0015538AC1|nr:hypothetical protein [Limosilactobacillus reuteri]
MAVNYCNSALSSFSYYNDHDLSSLWEYDILRAKIDYLRVRGTQMATGKQIFNDIFNEM